jgi:hypothetical protein
MPTNSQNGSTYSPHSLDNVRCFDPIYGSLGGGNRTFINKLGAPQLNWRLKITPKSFTTLSFETTTIFQGVQTSKSNKIMKT